MPEVTYAQAAPVSTYSVEVDGRQVRVNKVTIPEVELPMAEMVNGGDPYVRKVMAGPAKYSEVVITRYLDGSEEDSFFQDLFQVVFSPTGASAGSRQRYTIAIVKSQVDGTEVRRWILHECWPTKWTVTEQDAASNDLQTEEFTLACDYWEIV